MEIVFKEFRNRFLWFLEASGAVFSDGVGPENGLENETIFSKKTNLEHWMW